MKTLHLFAGAGGGLLADLILGHEPIGAVEIEPYCCEVLRRRAEDGWFPDLRVHETDIRLFDPSEYAGRVDCVSGGFPCQDISLAGKGQGITGERSGLWSEFARVLRLVRPRYAFIENSPMLTLRGLDVVLSDLASLGFDAKWAVVSAADAGAPHLRERIWILAHTDGMRESQSEGPQRNEWRRTGDGCHEVADANGIRRQRTKHTLSGERTSDMRRRSSDAGWWQSEPCVCGMADELAVEFHETEEHVMMGFISNGGLYAIGSERPDQALQVLRCDHEQEALQRTIGRPERIQEKEILRSSLHGERHDPRGCNTSGIEGKGHEVSQNTMRNMQNGDRTTGSSYRQQSIEQCTGKLDDVMRVMPYEMALRTREEQQKDPEEVSDLRQASEKERALQHPCDQDVSTRRSSHGSWWEEEPDIGRLAPTGSVAHRAHRLKALGNGQVPIQAAIAWKILYRRG